MQGHFYVTYHNQRNQTLAKGVPGRSFVISCGDSNWGTSVGPSAVGLRVVFFQSKADSKLLFNYRYDVDRHPSRYLSAPCCTATKKTYYGELLTLKSEVPQAGTQRPYPRSSLFVLPSGDSSCANIRRNIENRVYADTPLVHFRQVRHWYRCCRVRYLDRKRRTLKMP